MAKTVRSATVSAPPEELWRVISDPRRLVQWWPGVTRVENVRGDHFTQVIPTKRGKPVRLDQEILERDEPTRIAWSLIPEGTPFERLLVSWSVALTVQPEGEGSRVTIGEEQQLRGSFKLGGILQRGPARRRVKGALAALEQMIVSGEGSGA